MTPQALLNALHHRAIVRARYLAAGLPGVSAEDLFQDAALRFLKAIDRWLLQAPTVSPSAQAWTLMVFCLRQAATDEVRRRKRLANTGAEDEDIESRLPPAPETDAGPAAALLAQIRAVASPPNALCLLSLRLPVLVEPTDPARAKAYTKGGAKAVPRALEEAWAIYVAGCERPPLVADDVAWKDHVGVAWYTDGPVEALSEGTRRDAASKVERYANRGADELRNALVAEGETP
jgi:hypothetical protein